MAKRTKKTNPAERAVYDLLWSMMADAKLKAPAKCVGVALLLKFRNAQTGQCNPSFATLGKVVGRDRRNVIDALTDLKAGGWVLWEGTAGGSKASTNKFSFPRLTGDEVITPTGDELITGDELGSRGDELVTIGVMNSSHELSIEPSKNLSAESGAPRSKERAPVPSWAEPAGKGQWFIKCESIGGDLIRRYCEAQRKPQPFVSKRQDAFIVPYITPPGSAPVTP